MRHSSIVLLLLVSIACGPHPTAPSAMLGATAPGGAIALETASPLEVRSVTGRVTNVLSGAAVAGVTVRIADIGDIAADASGSFALDSEAPDGTYRLTASGAGVVDRQASLVFPGQAAVLPLIPSTFNMQAFDDLARSFGEPGVLKRWVDAPGLIVETALLDREASLDAAGAPLESVVASGEQMSDAAINEVVGQLTRALPLLTGGRFAGFSSVNLQTTAAGAPVPFDTGSNAIVVARYPGTATCRGFTSIVYTGDYAVVAARLLLQVCTGSLAGAVAAHELGHALGYGHVAGAASVMAATVTVDVTEFDRQAGTIAHQRAPGNRAPDVDPETATVNQPLRFRAAGPLRVVPLTP
ncbi:MAG: hypothetical protein A3I61_17465 [Acidobacteria bacterium RIFCSPLOWO2_02_FULL_68_18]|nr:MAG: hypothetical protein A3I61_17465 [Acidobacteria bacterium RIFCSPLOWO2_02_FULL_68_18]OFW50465.1 MAG: hypothetical protein A3G77_12035 [Acidobacteria bacterium RIFCSPLOWO2_12_FULL_68_19]